MSSKFCEMSAMVTNCATDTPKWFCEPLEVFFLNFDLFIYPEEHRYIVNGFRLSPAVGLAFP